MRLLIPTDATDDGSARKVWISAMKMVVVGRRRHASPDYWAFMSRATSWSKHKESPTNTTIADAVYPTSESRAACKNICYYDQERLLVTSCCQVCPWPPTAQLLLFLPAACPTRIYAKLTTGWPCHCHFLIWSPCKLRSLFISRWSPVFKVSPEPLQTMFL